MYVATAISYYHKSLCFLTDSHSDSQLPIRSTVIYLKIIIIKQGSMFDLWALHKTGFITVHKSPNNSYKRMPNSNPASVARPNKPKADLTLVHPPAFLNVPELCEDDFYTAKNCVKEIKVQ